MGTLRSQHRASLAGVGVDRHDGGLIVRTREATHEVPFDDIDAIWVALGNNGTLEALDLVTFDHTRLRIPGSVSELGELLAALDRECIGPLTTEAKAALARGESLLFGPLTLDRDHLEHAGWSHRFRDLRTVRVILGRLVLLHGKLTLDAVELATVPHPMVFLRLLEHLGPPLEIEGPRPFTPP